LKPKEVSCTINQRVRYYDTGLLTEAKHLIPTRIECLANWAIELFSYLDEDFTLQFAVEEIKKTQGALPSDKSLGSGVINTKWFDYLTHKDKIIDYRV
jgi:tRNA dimethylallyltransferase